MKYKLLLALVLSVPAISQYCNELPPVDTSILSSKGASFKLVEVSKLAPYPTTESFERQLERDCGWLGSGGTRKNNLIVLVIATLDHKVGIYYGSTWHRALDSRYQGINQMMIPFFRNNDFPAGITMGVQEIAKAIDQTQNATTKK